MSKKKVDWKIVCFGLACLTILELYALSKGINGWRLSIVIAIIAGVIGYTIPNNLIKQ